MHKLDQYTMEGPNMGHVWELVATMRSEDALECQNFYGLSPYEVVMNSIKTAVSRDTRVALFNGRVLGIFGVSPWSLLSESASPWLLTSNLMKEHPLALMRYSKLIVGYWRERYSLLENFIPADYDQALRWAKWLGFSISEPAPYGPKGVLFCKIQMRN